MTICPNVDLGYKNNILNQYGFAANDLRDSIKFPPNLNMTLSKFFEEITYNIEYIVFSIDVRTGIKQEASNYKYFKFMTDVNQGGEYIFTFFDLSLNFEVSGRVKKVNYF